MVGEAVHLNVTADRHVRRGDKLVVFVNVLVLSASEQGTGDDARVLDGGLINRNTVITQVKRYDEAAIYILWNFGVKPSCVSEDLLVIVNTLKEVTLGLLRN